MSRKSQALGLAVRLAVEAVCLEQGRHAACPIARALVEMATRSQRERDPDQGRGLHPTGDRAARPVRPEERRDKLTRLTPEEGAFPIPPTWPLAIAPYAVRRAIISGMAAHVTGTRLGAPISAGGRVVQSIAQRVTSGGRTRRLEERGGEVGFIPGESGF